MSASWPSSGFLTSFLNNINLNNNFKIITNDTDDPTSVAKNAPQNSIYARSGTTQVFLKMDNGLSTNWEQFGSFQDMLIYFGQIQDDPTGFPDTAEAESTLSVNNGLRQVTITPTGANFTFYQKGTLYTKSAPESIVIPNSEGTHFIYYNNGSLASTQIFSDAIIKDYVYVAAVRWDATNLIFNSIGNERHRHKMPSSVHSYLHSTFGSQYRSGFALGDFLPDDTGNLDTHAQFSTALGRFDDEDIPFNLPAVAVGELTAPIWYLSGATPVWRRSNPTGFAVQTTGTGRAAFNEFTGGAWQQTEVTNNNYVLAHEFKTNDEIYPTAFIQGQAQYNTIALARAGATTEINSLVLTGLPTQEWIPIGTVIFQTSNGYANTVKSRVRTTDTGANYVDWRQQGLSPANTAGDHGTLTGLTDDDHLQYKRIPTMSTVTGVNAITNANIRNTHFSADSSGGDVTFNLDALATFGDGFEFTIIKTSASNNVIINGNGAETINGLNPLILKAQYASIRIVKQSAQWYGIQNITNNNFTATTAPTVNNDQTQGYKIGSLWLDATNNILYIAESVGTGAASWIELLTNNAVQTASNKFLDSATVLHRTATARDFGIDQSAQANTTKLTLATPITASRTLTVPDATDTLVGRATADTLTNKKYSGGTATAINKHVLSRETLANLTALAREQGSLYYDTTNDQVVYDTGAALININPLYTDDPHLMYNLGLSTSLAASALTINLKQKDGSTDPNATNPVKISVKNGDGSYTVINITSSMSITVPSGATLGHASAVAHYIYVYLISDGASSELAVSRIQISERSLISSTAISSSADLNSVLYSTNTKTNKYIKCIGRLTSTQATAGTWSTAMSDVTVGGYDIQGIEELFFHGWNSGQVLSGLTGITWTTETTTAGNDSHNINTGSSTIYLPFACKVYLNCLLTHTTATHSTTQSFNMSFSFNGSISNGTFVLGNGASTPLSLTMSQGAVLGANQYVLVNAETALGAGQLLANLAFNRLTIRAIPIL